MKKLILTFSFFLICFCSAFAANQHQNLNLTQIFNNLSKKYKTVISFSPTITDKIVPASMPKGNDLQTIIPQLLNGTQLTYKVVGKKMYAIIVNPDFKKEPPLRRLRQRKMHLVKKMRPSHDIKLDYLPAVPHVFEKEARWAFKTNALADLTTNLSLGAEYAVTPQWSVEVPVSLNLWKLGDMSMRHFAVMPGVRYWTKRCLNTGCFFGLQANYAHYNVGDFPNWSIFSDNIQSNHYKGNLFGASVSCGYHWSIAKNWSMEAEIGIGYARLIQDKYAKTPAADGNDFTRNADRNYFGPTRLSLNFVYLLK